MIEYIGNEDFWIIELKASRLKCFRYFAEPSISEVNPEWQKRIGKAGRRMQWSQALYIDIEDLIAERNNFRVAIGTTWTVLGKRLTLPVFRLLRMYVLSHGGFRYAFAECKMRARRRNSTYYGTIPSWGRKGGEEMGMRQGTIIVAAMRSFFLSRVMLSFPRCVCYSTVKEYRFCTSQWVRDN